MDYADIAAAVAEVGMLARGGFAPGRAEQLPVHSGGRAVRTIVIIGNVGDEMWWRFLAERRDEPDPLDGWTRRVLQPIADRFGADFVHPSDEPFAPFQLWACRADDVWPSPIGLLIHPEFGLWHAYRGALLFPVRVDGLPAVGRRESPCLSCADRPCLSACPVGAFSDAGYDAMSCRTHVASARAPDCLHTGCAARRACPVATPGYPPDQMEFHMRAFLG